MTEKPILFSGAMVRAILDGRKFVTRRALKPQPQPFLIGSEAAREPCEVALEHIFDDPWPRVRLGRVITSQEVRYRVGLRLWVRETWKPHSTFDGMIPSQMPQSKVFYKADGKYAPSDTRWRSPIHMPRWASRITLLVTGVRVERLQDISEADVDAEGFGGDYPHAVMPDVFPPPIERWGELTMQECYARLWDAINGPGAWDANPWVAVIKFRREAASADPR